MLTPSRIQGLVLGKHRPRSSIATSKLMRAVRRRDTKAERVLRRTLWRIGLRYRTHDRELPGTPDIVFRRARVAVFVDGDYWHGHIYIKQGLPGLKLTLRTRNRDFWVSKILRNVERDRRQSAELVGRGWKVMRFWESDVLRDSHKLAAKIRNYLRSKKAC